MNALPVDLSELDRDYQSASASVSMIKRLDTNDIDFLPEGITTRRQWINTIYRNRDHLDNILVRYVWPEEYDLQPFRDAIAQAEAKLEAMANEAKP